MEKRMDKEPVKVELEDGTVLYRCPDCEGETDENCLSPSEPCYYCPEECSTWGADSVTNHVEKS